VKNNKASVGYMHPGNWATDLDGGARFGCQRIWVLPGPGGHGPRGWKDIFFGATISKVRQALQIPGFVAQ
jgi:hypothetical protein